MTGYHWLMDDGAQHIGGGRPRMMTYSTDHTVTYYSWSYTSLVEEEYHLGPKGYPCWVMKPIVDNKKKWAITKYKFTGEVNIFLFNRAF